MAVKYVLVMNGSADADLGRINISLNRRDPDYATRWEAGLYQSLRELLEFPGPVFHARDEEASVHYGREVRRMLYHGPTRRRSGTAVRILFTLLPPAPDDPPETAETVIFLLRLLQGPQSLTSDTPEP